MGSNCTFMELKQLVVVTHLDDVLRSNRTFMELKFGEGIKKHKIMEVLIVPLWN